MIEQGGERPGSHRDPQGRHSLRCLRRRHAGNPMRGRGRPEKRIGFEMIIETALGMQNVHEIAAASKRNESPAFRRRRLRRIDQGARPISAAPIRPYAVLTDKDAAGNPRYPLGRHVALRGRAHGRWRRANGLRPVDGPVRRFLRSRRLPRAATAPASWVGEGKWAIHPRRWPRPTNSSRPVRCRGEEGSPHPGSDGAGEAEGKGAVSLDGRLIDLGVDPSGRGPGIEGPADRRRKMSEPDQRAEHADLPRFRETDRGT